MQGEINKNITAVGLYNLHLCVDKVKTCVFYVICQ